MEGNLWWWWRFGWWQHRVCFAGSGGGGGLLGTSTEASPLSRFSEGCSAQVTHDTLVLFFHAKVVSEPE